MHTPSRDRMPALLAYYGDTLKPKDKAPLAFMKAHFGIADEPLAKAIDKHDAHTAPMFGGDSRLQVRKVGVSQNPIITKSQPRILFLKGGKPGAPGLFERAITGKDGVKRIHWMRMPKAAKSAHNERQGEMFDAVGTPYQSLETRPGTTDQQRIVGMSALAALEKRVNLLRDRGGSAASLLGSRLYAGFVASGGNQLVGQKVSSAGDVAALAQVYRDPRFETFRVFYVKGDTVAGEAAYSSRLPGAVQLPHDIAARILADKTRFEADGYYLSHNHPSGSAQPSTADLSLTANIAASVDGYRDHVVINHNEYATITAQGLARLHDDQSLSAINFTGAPAIDHPLLGAVISSPKDAALAAKVLQKDGEIERSPVLLMTKGHGSLVDLVMSVPMSIVTGGQSHTRTAAWLRGIGRASGAGAHQFLCVNDRDYQEHKQKLAELIEYGVVTDVVSASGRSLAEHGAGRRFAVKRLFDTRFAGRKVADIQRLSDDLEQQGRWLTDRAVTMGYASIDDLAENDYPAFERMAGEWREQNAVEDALYQPTIKYRNEEK